MEDSAIRNPPSEIQEAAVFERMMRRYKERVYRYVWRLTRDVEDAEDITQEVFLRAYRARGTFRGESRFQTWLYRIATNLCIDRARSRQRQVEAAFSLDEPLDADEGERGWELSDWSQDPCREVERAELRQRVQECLGTLPEKLRRAVLMYYVQGCTYEETAQLLGCPVGTVKSRLFSARALLARKLRSYVEG